ncbi:Cytochrome P450 monooxygenase 75 [Psilocybe cubensis]|uniref:Cytochrome P450 monooxygenase 75 n=1 Tax=Psilocybe cubensis TaxID=181762 RepID=A0ACB8GHR3_PSICU|nr:Cytochrome P450 monooxygenase 75 [Psilocybe cubensis]KAH9475034.1 Cytochrome P450 monooxygenase 75 [Psilocybe cubensis]
MNPANYRARLLWDCFRIFVIPASVLSSVLLLLGYQLGLLSIPTHLGFILLWGTLKSLYAESKQEKEARAIGAKTIPCVIGKWPGNVDVLFRMVKAFKNSYVLDVYLELFEEYQCTTLNLRVLWRDNIISMDQEHAKYVTSTGFSQFWRGISQKERMELFLGEGIFNRDDEKWKMHRNMTRPFFSRERFSDFELFERHCARTISILSSLEASGTACDAQDLYGRFSLDAASEFLMGKNLDTLSASLPVAGKTAMGPKGSATEDHWGSFTRAFEMAQLNITHRGRLGAIWPLFELFKDKNEEHCKVIRAWMDPLTACALTFLTYFLAIHPDVATKMRAEILEYCGPTSPPTFDNIKRMKYMRAVINETLRLFPPVPLNVRETRTSSCVLPPSDCTFSTGSGDSKSPLYMPAKTTILYLPLLIQRNPAHWGADADEFKPERWIDPESVARYVANPTIFTPFSAGPRICIGQNYAYNEMSYFLVRLLQKFDKFTLCPEFQPEGSLPPLEWKNRKGRQAYEQIWPSAALTLYVKGGLWVKFHRARS